MGATRIKIGTISKVVHEEEVTANHIKEVPYNRQGRHGDIFLIRRGATYHLLVDGEEDHNFKPSGDTTDVAKEAKRFVAENLKNATGLRVPKILMG